MLGAGPMRRADKGGLAQRYWRRTSREITGPDLGTAFPKNLRTALSRANLRSATISSVDTANQRRHDTDTDTKAEGSSGMTTISNYIEFAYLF